MKSWICALALVGIGSTTSAQELPAETRAGREALDRLIRRCIDGNLLVESKTLGGFGPARIGVADPARLRAFLETDRPALTPELRDALARSCGLPGVGREGRCSLLHSISEVSGDPKASAFASYFLAESLPAGQALGASSGFREAARSFEESGLKAWQGRALRRAGDLLDGLNQPGPALDCYREALALYRMSLGERHEEVGMVLNSMGFLKAKIGRSAEAAEDDREALAIFREVHGERHDRVAATLNNLGEVEYGLGHLDASIDAFRQALETWRALHGDLDGRVATCLSNLGSAYSAKGRKDEAIRHQKEALAIRLRCFGDDHADVANSLNNLGDAQAQFGDYVDAMANHERALAIRRKVFGDRHPQVAVSLSNLGSVRSSLGDREKAREDFELALSIRLEAHGERHPDVAASLNNLAATYFHLGDPRKSREFFEHALKVKRGLYGDRHPDVALALNNLGFVRGQLGDPRGALALYRESLEIRREILGPRHPDVAHSLLNLAALHGDLGQAEDALSRGREALEIYLAVYGERHPQVANCLNNMASVHADAGRVEEALGLHRRALAIRRVVYGEQHREVANSHNNIGVCLAKMGEFEGALREHGKAMEIEEAVQPTKNTEVARSHNNIGYALAGLGRLERARGEYREAIRLWGEIYGEAHADVAACLNNLAGLDDRVGDYDQAILGHRRAMAIWKARLGDRHPEVARSLYNIGAVQSRRREYAAALDSYSLGLEIWKEAYGNRHPRVASCLGNIGGAYADLGEYDRAIEWIDLALFADQPELPAKLPPTSEWAPGMFRPTQNAISTLQLRGNVLAKRVEARPSPEGARDCLRTFEAAADVLERYRERVVMSDSSKLRIGESSPDLAPRMIAAASRLTELSPGPEGTLAAFAAAERGSARVFLERLGRSRAGSMGRVAPTLLEEEARLKSVLADLGRQVEKEQSRPMRLRDRSAVEGLLASERKADRDLDLLVGRMDREFPQYRALKYPEPCSIERARACLADDELGLLYVVGLEASYLLVVEKRPAAGSAGVAIHRLPPADQIAELVSSLLSPRVLGDPEAVRERGAEAFRVLLEPVARTIEGKRLVIVPGGPLGQLPFAMLVEPGGRYLAELQAVRYAPSMTALSLIERWEQGRPPTERPLWVLGDPIYSEADPRVSSPRPIAEPPREAPTLSTAPRDSGFDRLVGSGLEVERLGSAMGARPEERAVGLDASEVAVKRLSSEGVLEKFRYIHFACHGVLGDDGEQPGLVLSQVGDRLGQDGYLRLDEVTGLKLNADLVVLSACRTGQGTVAQTEGVTGLARAFLYAGSRGVLCSLWRIDDAATADLMADVYANLKAGQSSADALRSAQREMIEAGEPPLHWAPFVLIGR